jgi:ABC-type multidrug transport system fused ATPase/permease subunit
VAGYRAIMRGRTTVLISHRGDLAACADLAIVLDGARIVEEGSPGELRSRGMAFARLFGGAAAAR